MRGAGVVKQQLQGRTEAPRERSSSLPHFLTPPKLCFKQAKLPKWQELRVPKLPNFCSRDTRVGRCNSAHGAGTVKGKESVTPGPQEERASPPGDPRGAKGCFLGHGMSEHICFGKSL